MAAVIAAPVLAVATSGYAAAGDGGAALYKRTTATLSVAGFTAADGSKWELAETTPTFEMFGAVGDGSTDDSAAVSAAVSGAWRAIRVLPKAYAVKNIQPANGVSLVAAASQGYTTDVTTNRPVLIKASGTANAVLNLTGVSNFTMVGVNVDGVDQSAPCISAGGSRVILERVQLVNGLFGLGGAIGGGSAYTQDPHFVLVEANNNVTGFSNPIDGRFVNCTAADNYTNVSAGNGSNSNVWIGGRIEWAQGTVGGVTAGTNISLFQADSWQFVGTLIDRGGLLGADIKSCTNILFSGTIHRRAAALNTGSFEADCHFYIESCTGVVLDGVITTAGANDDGSGVVTPRYVVKFNGANNRITITGGDFSGYTSAPVLYNTTPTNLKIRNVAGLPDLNNADFPKVNNGKIYQDQQSAPSNVAPAGSGTVTLTTVGIATFSRRKLTLDVWCRDASTGLDFAASFNILVRREGGSAAVSTSTVFGEIGTASSIQFSSTAGTIRLALGTIAADGSSIAITATNAHATDSFSVSMELR